MIKKIALFFFLCLAAIDLFGQETDSSSTTFLPLPVVFYTPETRWGFGAATFFSWRFKDEPIDS